MVDVIVCACKKMLFAACYLFFGLILLACVNVLPPMPEIRFAERQILGTIELDSLDEISGLAVSQSNAGVLWVHNDSGGGRRIYAMTKTGKHLATFEINGCWALDWEDITLGPGPVDGVDYLYIGDIGDNFAIRPFIEICRVVEPEVKGVVAEMTTLDGEAITLQYPEGARDAEALMIDARSKDLYLVSKRESNVSVFYAAYPYDTSMGPVSLTEVAVLPLTGVSAGDISYDAKELLLRSSKEIFYWRRMSTESLIAMLQRMPVVLTGYEEEGQSEAIAWAREAKGFYTVSEERLGVEASVGYYPRLLGFPKKDFFHKATD